MPSLACTVVGFTDQDVDKPHVCPTCGKGFSAKQALTQHMFIHSDQKPLECAICRKTFRYPSALSKSPDLLSLDRPETRRES